MTPGHRLRVLAEKYDSHMSAEQAGLLAEEVKAVLVKHFPDFYVMTYVESNPPADEVDPFLEKVL